MSIAFTHRRYIGKSSIEDGTEAHPFLIKDAFDFVAFKQAIEAGNTFDGIHHLLVNDIDLTGVTIPHGGSYYGIFNGGFRVLKNITINGGSNPIGLFYQIYDGTIKNLGIKNITLISTKGIGGLAMSCYGSIENCFITGNISNTSGDRAGAIAAWVNSTDKTIKNCLTNVNIKIASNRAAGIAVFGGPNSSKIENCIALGNIDAGTQSYAGGITADKKNTDSVLNCVAAMSSIISTYTNGVARVIHPTSQGGINNYALDSMLTNGSIPTANIQANQANGANATESQLKSTAFYRDVLGWDMDTVWEVETEGVTFPRLRGFNYNF